MATFEEILKQIEQAIKELHFDYSPQSLFDPIEYTLSLGGKRIRPAMVLMAYNLYREKTEEILNTALGLEVFHNFTLLHDDLMDEADKRRNKPTVHKVWNANAAILSGDAMLIAAYQLIAKTEPKHLKPVLDLFSQTAMEICCGQQYDMEFETRQDVTEEEYIEMIRLKTAVLLACSLKVGAILADASAEDAEHLYQFGINIGLAFQLQDDLLDVYGDTETFGKNIGGDILCDKKTFLLINAFRRSDDKQLAELNRWIGKKTEDPKEKINAVTAIYNELQLKKLSEDKIENYFAIAMKHLTAVSVASEKKNVLKELSERLMNRKS